MGPVQTLRLTFRDVLDYKFHMNRSIDRDRKIIFSTTDHREMAQKPLFLDILGSTSQTLSAIAPRWVDLEKNILHAHFYERYQRPCHISDP